MTGKADGMIFSHRFVVVKIIMGVNLVGYASRRRAGMEAREEEDKINDFGRDPIGEGQEERVRSHLHILPHLVIRSSPNIRFFLDITDRNTTASSRPFSITHEMMHTWPLI